MKTFSSIAPQIASSPWHSRWLAGLVCCFAFVLSSSLAIAADPQVQIVVPGDLATKEGDSSILEPFNSSSFRFQQVFDASQFAIPEGKLARIDSISFRLDGNAGASGVAAFGGGHFGLSTTLRNPDDLSTIFSENIGSDYLTIYQGALSLGGEFRPGEVSQPWRRTVLGRDFYYDPSQGNLLLEVGGFGRNIFTPRSMDATEVRGDSVSWIWATDGNSLSGTAETRGLVARFDITIVPEPSVWAVLVGGIGVAVVFRTKESARGFNRDDASPQNT